LGMTKTEDEIVMYYSISAAGMNPSEGGTSEFCVGRATGKFWSKMDATFVDSGSPVICVSSDKAERGAPHAIDPSVMVDEGGKAWLTFGSWSDYEDGRNQGARGGGVWMVELDEDARMLTDEELKRCG